MVQNAQALEVMIAAKYASPDIIKEFLSDIQAEGVLAAKIIERHRSMLRSHELQKKPIDLHTAVRESLALVAHDVRTRQIAVNVNLSRPCIVNGDQVLLQQVLVILIMNAMEAMAAVPTSRRHLTIASVGTGTDVQVTVRDTGPGLPPDAIGTLFTPFVTTKSHGVGIGLTIARSIVAAHNGTIEASNNPEGGATFTITLHAAVAAVVADESTALALERERSQALRSTG